jgi:hypothetical protein
VLNGLGAALAAPIILPAAGAVVRPLAKATIWGFLVASDKMKEMFAETREQMNDLVAEVRSEYSDGGGTAAVTRKGRPLGASA